MSFFKRDGDEILEAPNFVKGPGFELNKNDTSQTADGWVWYDTIEEAEQALLLPDDVVTLTLTKRELDDLQRGVDNKKINVRLTRVEAAL